MRSDDGIDAPWSDFVCMYCSSAEDRAADVCYHFIIYRISLSSRTIFKSRGTKTNTERTSARLDKIISNDTDKTTVQ